MAGAREIKVGAFVLAGLLIVGFLVFVIGDERSMFERKVEYRAVFKDVQGLKEGSSVRMGGFDVGSVIDVGYSDDPNDLSLYVTMSVVEGESRRIRTDSTAAIENKGLLGDKMITVKPGSPDQPAIPPGGTIPAAPSDDLAEMISRVSSIGVKAEKVVSNLEKTTGALSDKEFTEDVRGTVKNLNSVLEAIDKGDGYASRVLHDPNEAAKLSRTLANLERSTAELNQTLRNVNTIVRRVEQGPGFAHEVIYGNGPGQTLESFGRAADEVALTLKGVREGNGPAKSLIYGDEGSQELMGNLNAMSRDLRHIVKDVRSGKGTIGALLVDPSVYEDIKLLLGNVERNKTLRALVRYSIKRDEKAPRVEVVDPSPAPVTPGTPKAGDAVPVGKGGAAGDKPESAP
jgi:phospholipid/cholesterol/gamma-HCH transport system substrate-binding protein